MAPAAFDFVRRAVRQKITDVFNDADKGERPVLRRADALFPADGVAARVNGDGYGLDVSGNLGQLQNFLATLHQPPRLLVDSLTIRQGRGWLKIVSNA